MKKIVALLLIVTLFISIGFSASAETMNRGEYCEYTEVTWIKIYETYDEMIQDADYIVYGTVVSQTNGIENNHVFTNSIVEIDKSLKGEIKNRINIFQTGGKYENYITIPPSEFPLLKDRQHYLFFLKKSKDEVYYVIGAGQGIFREDEDVQISFVTHLNLIKYGSANSPTMVTPYNGYVYTSDLTVRYCIGSTFTTSQKNAVCIGVESWNGYSNLTLMEVSSFPDIVINTSNSTLYPNYSGCTFFNGTRSRTVEFYINNFDTTDLTNWKKLGAHEAGHCIGLAHNYSSPSVMYPTLSGQSTFPEYNDIVALQGLY